MSTVVVIDEATPDIIEIITQGPQGEPGVITPEFQDLHEATVQSELTAESHAIAALASENAAKASENAAALSEQASLASANEALNQATNAASSASVATTKANEALNSAGAAATSASNAATSASTASTRATEASSSSNLANTAKLAAEAARDVATVKATEASTSASSASNAAATATTKASEASTSAASASGSASAAAASAADATTAAATAGAAQADVATNAAAAAAAKNLVVQRADDAAAAAALAVTAQTSANASEAAAVTAATTATTAASSAATSATQAGGHADIAVTKAGEAATSAAAAQTAATTVQGVQAAVDASAAAAQSAAVDAAQAALTANGHADAAAADAAATAADRVQTGADRVQTGADRVQTGLDAQTATTRAAEAGTAMALARQYRDSAFASATTATGASADATAAAGMADQHRIAAETAATTATGAASTATTKAGEAAGSAAQALAIYSNTDAMNTALASAQNAASLAAGHAASASSVVQQDLSGVDTAALHRSPNAITAMFVYDTSKDSDGGAWTEKCQHTSWYNEELCGKWLGAQASEAAARAVSGATAGDYFQLTTDGKFYKLNDTSGITEVFRGNKRDFPRLAGIVAEASSVTIYDLTEPGRPMWMRFNRVPTSTFIGWANSSAASDAHSILNGLMVLCVRSYGGLLIDFAKDNARIIYAGNGSHTFTNRTIASRNTTSVVVGPTGGYDSIVLPSYTLNAVDMTVLPDAPVDPVTGLKVPTIAVATAGGVSVIKHDGSVRTFGTGAHALGSRRISVDAWSVVTGRAADTTPNFWQSKRDTFAVLPTGGNNSWGYYDLKAENLVSGSGGYWGTYPSSGFAIKKFDRSKTLASQTNGLTAAITNTFNTGHMTGDIRRAYLSDNVVGSVGPSTELVTNGTFDTDVSGWLTTTSDVIAEVVNGQLKVTNNGPGWVYQAVQVIPGVEYSLSGLFIKTGSGRFMVGNAIGSGTYLTGANSATYSNFLIIPTQSTIYISFGDQNGGGSVQIYDNVSLKIKARDRSYKAQGANITGTLTKSQVASSAQLVAYSGFSAENYLREPYSADLDFGTGEWSVGAWVNTVAKSTGINLLPNSGASTGPGMGGGRTITRAAFTDSATGIVADLLTATSGGTGCGADVYIPLQPGVPYTFSAWVGVPLDSTLTQLTVGVYGYGPSYTNVSVLPGVLTRVSVTVTVPNTESGIATWNSAVRSYGGLFGIWGVGSGSDASNKLYFAQLQLEIGSAPSAYKGTSNLPLMLAERSYSSGPSLRLALTYDYKLTATAYDGTTTRTVTSASAYNTGTWTKAEACYTPDGSLSIRVNGVEVAATRGNPLLTLNNPDAVLTIGNSYTLDAPFPGSIALLKLSATVPTAEQSMWMYEQEKHLFRDGAKCCLPDAGAILDLSYDEATDRWIAVSESNESEWSGLVRTNVKAVPAGKYTKLASGGGVKLEARSTTNPGVDITMPAYRLRSELVRRAEAAAQMNAQLATFDYVGGFTASTTSGSTSITSVAGLSYPTRYVGAQVSGAGIPAGTVVSAVSGTTLYLSKAATATATGVQISFTDFVLPMGHEAKTVMVAGAVKQEGATKDFTRLFDGFKETVRFAVAPAYNAWVQVQTTRSAA